MVAEDPRAVTVASVSLSASKYAGQFVPFVRQTVEPFTNSWVVETAPVKVEVPAPAMNNVPEALTSPESVTLNFCVELTVALISKA